MTSEVVGERVGDVVGSNIGILVLMVGRRVGKVVGVNEGQVPLMFVLSNALIETNTPTGGFQLKQWREIALRNAPLPIRVTVLGM